MELHPTQSSRSRLGWAIGATMAVVLVELLAGLLGGSVALLADAGHVAVDVLALAFAWLAARQAGRPPSGRQTYGYQRVGILVGLANAAVLLLAVGGISAAAALRLAHPARPSPALMLAAAGFGIVVNLLVVAYLLPDRSFNSRVARLHVAGDLLAGLGVVLAALVILASGWSRADPIISLLISIVIAAGALRLLREALPVLLEAAPRGVSLAAVEQRIATTPGVSGVHDLHVWQLALDSPALSCHLALDDQSLEAAEHLVQRLSDRLCRDFGLRHTTIQVEACHPCPPGLCANQVAQFDNHVHRARV
ncbi:MAG: cation diffusion facilitator family transporter [Candidatus Dormibacteria bacterium]